MPDRLLAGAAQTDITPPLGTTLAGAVAAHHVADSVLDPLMAKAVVFEQRGRRVCILSLDVTIVSEPYTSYIRAQASERCAIDPGAIMVHATQTHSAPAIGGFMLDTDFSLADEDQWINLHEPSFSDMAVERSVDAISQAVESLAPARIGYANATRDDLAFNRRAIRRDGTCAMPWVYSSMDKPLGQTDYRYIEGPIDPEVGVVWVQDHNMQTIAFLLQYTCHPVNVFYHRGRGRHGQLSADWPGAWAAELTARHGGVGLVVNGCCGNINPWPAYTPDFVPDHSRMGRELARTSEEALGWVQFSDRVPVDHRITEIGLPLRDPDPAELHEAKDRIAREPHPPGVETGTVDAWYRAASMVSFDLLRKRLAKTSGEGMQVTEPYEVQALRIGDIALVGLPGEPFVEGQLRLKIESPAYPTYVAHCTSHYAGYLPTPEAFPRGGHEANTSWWSRHTAESLDLAVDAAGKLLREIFR